MHGLNGILEEKMNDKSDVGACQQVSFVLNKSKNNKTVLKVTEVSFSIVTPNELNQPAKLKEEVSKNVKSEPFGDRTNMVGFSTCSGKPIELSEKARAYLKDKQSELANDVSMNGDGLDASVLENSKTESIQPQVGFATGSGKSIALSEKAKEYLRAKEQELQDENEDELLSKLDTSVKSFHEVSAPAPMPAPSFGFSTSSGKPIQLGEKARAYLKDKQDEFANDASMNGDQIDSSMLEATKLESLPNEPCTKLMEFSTGSGKSIALSEKAKEYLRAKEKELQDENEDELLSRLDTSTTGSSQPSKSSQEAQFVAPCSIPSFGGFSTSSGKPIVLSDKAKAYLRAKQDELTKDLPEEESSKSTTTDAVKMETSLSTAPESFPSPFVKPSGVGFSTCSGKSIQIGEKAREYLKAKQNEHFSMPLPEGLQAETKAPVPPVRMQGKKFTPPLMKTPLAKPPPKFYVVKPVFELTKVEVKANESALLFDANLLENLEDSDDIETKLLLQDPSIGEVKNKNISEPVRATAFRNLKSRLEAKRNTTMTLSERSRPGRLYEIKSQRTKETRVSLKRMRELCTSSDTNTNRQNEFVFHEKPIESFKLNLEEFFDLKEYNQKGYVETPDGGHLVSDERFYVGVEELYNCFLDSIGVDAKLVDLAWFKNHLKWIAWKLDSYDRRFNSLNSPTRQLHPINILTQIKYRYDVEVGNGKRSCVRKLIEKDDTSINKLIILFVSKLNSQDSSFIELSDGWYPIKAQCDSQLLNYIRNKRLSVGDKIAIYSSEMVGCPKDGCPPLEAPSELHLKLSVNSTRKTRWFAPLGFVCPQRQLCVKLVTIKPNSNVGAVDVIIERIYPMLYLEKRPDGSKVFRNQRQEELFDYKHQMEMSNRFSENSPMNGTLDQKENQNPAKRNVSQLLKIRLIDAAFGSQTPKTNSTILTVWQNAADLRDKINEGRRVIILNLTATFQKNSFQDGATLCLGTNRQSNFLFPPKSAQFTSDHLERFNCEFGDIYSGRIVSSYSELDLCGIVISHLENSYQNMVFLTNLEDTNQSIVCVAFQKNADYHGFKDILKLANNVACLNLKFSRRLEKSKYPCLMASEISVFTQKISAYKHLTVKYNMLDEKMKSMGTVFREKLKELAEKIENDKSNYSMSNTSVNLFNKSGNLDRSRGLLNASMNTSVNNQSNSLCTPKDSRVISIAQIAEVSPIISTSKSGARHPGLTAKKINSANSSSSTPRIFNNSRVSTTGTPNIAASGSSTTCSTPANNSLNKNPGAAITSSFVANRLLKRTSDHFSMNTTTLSEDEDDSIISNQDLEALFSNQPSNLSLAKRKKL